MGNSFSTGVSNYPKALRQITVDAPRRVFIMPRLAGDQGRRPRLDDLTDPGTTGHKKLLTGPLRRL
jgi:hypothetical protein